MPARCSHASLFPCIGPALDVTATRLSVQRSSDARTARVRSFEADNIQFQASLRARVAIYALHYTWSCGALVAGRLEA